MSSTLEESAAWGGRRLPPAYPSLHVPLYVLSLLLSFLFCAARPSPYRKLRFIPYAALSLFFIYRVRTPDLVQNYSQASTVATNLFAMLDFLVLTDIQNALRKKDQVGEIKDKGFWERFKWSFSLVTSPRGISWAHEPANIPRTRTIPRTRLQFLFQKSIVLLKCLALYVFADVAMQLDPGFTQHGPSFAHPGRAWYLRPMILAHGLASRSAIHATYTIAGIVSVMLGLSGPEEWPPFFGSFAEAWSVRRFWRCVWHQLMRRVSRLRSSRPKGI